MVAGDQLSGISIEARYRVYCVYMCRLIYFEQETPVTNVNGTAKVESLLNRGFRAREGG